MHKPGQIIWPVRLFNKSVLKQNKYRQIAGQLGDTAGMRCLDIGSDNGVVSYLLRKRGGEWVSADLDTQSVAAIRLLVGSDVYRLDGGLTPFNTGEFDRVVIIDFLEHIPDDAGFIQELYRILRPGGELIVNVPHLKPGLMRTIRYALGQTDEKHGHLRPGYRLEDIGRLLGENFSLQASRTYSKFFSELIDALIVYAVSMLQRGKKNPSKKGLIVTGEDLDKNRSMFRIYSLIYPIVWLVSKLDALLFFTSGYMLIIRASVNKLPAVLGASGNGHKQEKVELSGR